MTVVLEARDLWKIYRSRGHQVVALRGVSLEVERGSISTLLGQNGAGKTTFIRIAATQLLPTRGTIRVLGYDVVEEVWEVRERIAVVPQEARPLLFPSPMEYVTTLLVMRGITWAEARARAREALEDMEVPREKWDKSTWSLSGGMRRRVILAAVLAMDADVVFLDEPSIGLDPLARRGLWSKISRLREQGKTVLLTTHYMEEAEVLSDRVFLIHGGRVHRVGSPRELVDSLPWRYKVEVTSECPKVGELRGSHRVVGESPPYTIYAPSHGEAGELLETLTRVGCRASSSPVDLEDVFILTVGERISPEAGEGGDDTWAEAW